MVQKSKILTQLKRYIILFIGSIIYAAGIEIFLVPNNVIDGGVVGISIMASHLTGLPLGLFLIAVCPRVDGYFYLIQRCVLSIINIVLI